MYILIYRYRCVCIKYILAYMKEIPFIFKVCLLLCGIVGQQIKGNYCCPDN